MKYCIFIERIFDDEVFETLKYFLSNHVGIEHLGEGPGGAFINPKFELFVTTPANYELAVAEQGYRGTKRQLSKIMKKRYTELFWCGYPINLHLHLSLRPEKMKQEAIFKEAVTWLKKNVCKPDKITFGWYAYSPESIKLAKKYGIERFKDNWYYSFHDYESLNIYSLIMILQNIRGWFRK